MSVTLHSVIISLSSFYQLKFVVTRVFGLVEKGQVREKERKKEGNIFSVSSFPSPSFSRQSGVC